MSDGTGQIIVVAGATGDLGGRVVAALVRRGAEVRALVRAGTAQTKIEHLREGGALPVLVDFDETNALQAACQGASCVVSTLNGLAPIMLELQGRVLDAAVAAGVPRFMPSDFSLDFTRTRPGDNRNLDLRRQFAEVADKAPIKVQSVLNGMFMELLPHDARVILPKQHRVFHWGDPDQLLDLTTKDDVADFVADVALDPEAPRWSRIAGSSVSMRQIGEIMSRVTGERYRLLRPGGIRAFGVVINVVKTLSPKSDDPFPAWQGMQYMRDMLSGSGKLDPLDNGRYGKSDWTTAEMLLTQAFGGKQ